jgi:hypothetical protein
MYIMIARIQVTAVFCTGFILSCTDCSCSVATHTVGIECLLDRWIIE